MDGWMDVTRAKGKSQDWIHIGILKSRIQMEQAMLICHCAFAMTVEKRCISGDAAEPWYSLKA